MKSHTNSLIRNNLFLAVYFFIVTKLYSITISVYPTADYSSNLVPFKDSYRIASPLGRLILL